MNQEWETLEITCIDEMLAHFAPTIENWLRVLHDAGLRVRLDPEQEEVDIFVAIDKRLKKLDWRSMECWAVLCICGRITRHVVINAEVFEKRDKRNLPGTGVQIDSADIVDHSHGCNPECDLEDKECVHVPRLHSLSCSRSLR